jgi:hypothetical protein
VRTTGTREEEIMGVWNAVKAALGMGTCSAGGARGPSEVPRAVQPGRDGPTEAPIRGTAIIFQAVPAVQAPTVTPDPTFGPLNAERFQFGPRLAARSLPFICDGVLNEGCYEWNTFKSRLMNADRYEWRLPDVMNAARFGWRERLNN